MLRLAVVFLVIALVAVLLGFGGVAALSFEGAKILFVIFLVRGYRPTCALDVAGDFFMCRSYHAR